MRDLLPFLNLLNKHKAALLLGFGLSLLTALAATGLLALSGWFISAAAYAGLTIATAAQFNYLIPGAAVRLLAYTRILGRYSERLVTHNTTFKILADLRVWFFQHLEPLAPGYLLYHRSGDLLNRAVQDVDALDNLYLRVLTPTLIAACFACAISFFISFFSFQIAILLFTLFVLTGVVLPSIAHRCAASASRNLLLCLADLRTHLVLFIQGLTELLIFGAEQTELNKISKKNSLLLSLQKKLIFIQGINAGLMVLIAGLTMLGGLYIGANLVLEQKLNGANLALIVLAILASFEVLAPLPIAYQYLGKTRKAAQRLLEIAQTPISINFPACSQAQPKDASLALKNISFSYPQTLKPVFSHFDLDLGAGDKIALMGASGSGKSTLLHLIARFLEPEQGNIFLGDVNIKVLSETDLRSRICLISQKPYLFNATLRANLLIAKPDANDEELLAALEVVQLKDFVLKLPEGLNTFVKEAGLNFSGGQIRRIALARAILHQAPIWLLDEPTEGLDRITEQALIQTLKLLLVDRTVILSTHNKASLSLVDRVIQL